MTEDVLGAGVHELTWDGFNEEGRAAAAGVYLVRVSTVEGAAGARFVIVR